MIRSFISTLFFILLSAGGCSRHDNNDLPSREERLSVLNSEVASLEQLATNTRPARRLNSVLYDLLSFQDRYPDDLDGAFGVLYMRAVESADEYYGQINPESYTEMCQLRDHMDIRDTDYLLYSMEKILMLDQYLDQATIELWDNRVLEYALVVPRYCDPLNTQWAISRVWDSRSPGQEISEQVYQVALMQHAFCVKDGCLPKAGHELLTTVSPDTFSCSSPDATVDYAYHWGARAGLESYEIGAQISTIFAQCHATGYYIPLE